MRQIASVRVDEADGSVGKSLQRTLRQGKVLRTIASFGAKVRLSDGNNNKTNASWVNRGYAVLWKIVLQQITYVA